MLVPRSGQRARRAAEVRPARRTPCLAEIRDAEDRAHAEVALQAFADEFAAKWPKAVAKLVNRQATPCSPSTTSPPSTGCT